MLSVKDDRGIQNGIRIKNEFENLLCQACIKKVMSITVDRSATAACVIQGLTRPGRRSFHVRYNSAYTIKITGDVNKYDGTSLNFNLELLQGEDDGYEIYTVQDFLEIDTMSMQHKSLTSVMDELLLREDGTTCYVDIQTQLTADMLALTDLVKNYTPESNYVFVRYKDAQFCIGALPLEGYEKDVYIRYLKDEVDSKFWQDKCELEVQYPAMTVSKI